MASSAITAELALEIKGFLEGVKKAQDSARNFSKTGSDGSSKWAKGLGGVGSALGSVGVVALKAAAGVAAVGAAAATGLAAGIKNAFDMGGNYAELAERMGTTAGQARILGAAFEGAGMGADDAATTIDKMQKGLVAAANGSGSAMEAFNSLGLDANSLVEGDPTAAFATITAALRGVSSETERTALSMEIFGKSGGKLAALIADEGAMDGAAKLVGGQAALLDENAAKFDRASDTLNQIGTKLQGFFVGVGSKIIDAIMPAIDALEALDLSGMGERFGAALATALNYAVAIFQALSNMGLEKIGSLLGAALRLGFGEAVNFLFKGGAAAFSAIIAYFIEGIKNTVAIFQILTTSSFWAGMLNTLLGIGKIFAGFLATRISQLITAIKEATGPLGKKIFGDSDKGLAEQGAELMAGGKENLAQAGTDLKPTFDKIGERVRATGAAMGDAFKNTFNNATDMIDTSDDKNAIASVASEIAQAADNLKNGVKEAEPVAPATGGAEGAVAEGGLPAMAMNSRLSGAINTISGRSANAVIASEAAKTSANTERTAKAAEEIAKNTKPSTPKQPTPKPQGAGSGRFA